jgi:predicted ATPase
VADAVNRWLGPGRLGTPYRLKLHLLDADRAHKAVKEGASSIQKLDGSAEATELLFEDVQAGTLLSHRDIGFGVGQVLQVLGYAALWSKKLIAIEQPELHLHPAQQAELGDVFIESALGERKNTFLLETYSEHLILRILRRVRETTEGKLPSGATPVRPEDISVVYVQPGPKGAEVRELSVTADGDFGCPWPGGFFAERFQELP